MTGNCWGEERERERERQSTFYSQPNSKKNIQSRRVMCF